MASKTPGKGPGAMTTGSGKTAITTTMKPVFGGRKTSRGGKHRGGRRR